MTAIYFLGSYAPAFLWWISNLALFYLRQPSRATYYNLGFMANIIINIILKNIFQQPRPSENIKWFHQVVNQRTYAITDDIFGMPSGHAQTCMYSLCYVFLSTRQASLLAIYAFFTGCALFSKYNSKQHSMFQLFIGSCLGIFTDCVVFYYSNILIV